MKITVVGGGNVGTLIAGEFTKRHHQVTMYTRDKSKWKDIITVYDEDTKTSYQYTLANITESVEQAVKDAEIIFIVLPAFAIRGFIDKAYKYINKNTIVGFYPGTGGVDFISKPLLDKGCTIFGTQRICSVVRLKKYGEYVVTSGKRKDIYLGSIPKNKAPELSRIFSELFDVATHPLPNYLNVTLTSSNPILHPSRLYTLYKDYYPGYEYKKVPLFYEDWTDEASKLLIACDEELHQILAKINLDTSHIRPLLEHYESNNYQEMTAKIHSINSFKGITSPAIKTENGYIPDLNNRYFIADIPYGLMIIKDFAMICHIETPNIDKILKWYQSIVGKEYFDFKNNNLGKDSKDLSIPELYNIKTIEDINNFYKE